MTPMPPAWAMAIAMRYSVTVSMAEEMIGMFRAIVRVMRVFTSTSPGITSERPGRSRTSSKVRASSMDLMTAMANSASGKALSALSTRREDG